MQSENIKVSNHSNIGVIIIFTWNTSDYCGLLINEHIIISKYFKATIWWLSLLLNWQLIYNYKNRTPNNYFII